jgi:hypothetical protein
MRYFKDIDGDVWIQKEDTSLWVYYSYSKNITIGEIKGKVELACIADEISDEGFEHFEEVYKFKEISEAEAFIELL